MCGIAGAWFAPERTEVQLLDVAKRMSDALRHRGPDAEGQWCDPAVGIALAHRRLSIVDLSPTGAQPMASSTGRFEVVFNGEIYNFRRLREELRALGATFRGGSDTEVLLAACEAWGIPDAIRRCAGMFAIALFDRSTRQLWLARDRMGEKPLHFTQRHGSLLFASELTAIEQASEHRLEVSATAVRDVLERGHVRGRRTIYSDVHRLPPGHLACFSGPMDAPSITAYWTVQDAASTAAPPLDLREAVRALDDLLSAVVAEQMLADVPLGAFLSGGIDSSLITALMQQHSSRPVRTFTIAFGERSHNEADHALAVARHLGTDHTEIPLAADAALALVPSLANIYDEPFADSSQLPTVLVSRVTRQHVTVALSGDGGDELFGGYAQYRSVDSLANAVRRIPSGLRAPTAGLLAVLPAALQLHMPLGDGRWTPNTVARLRALLSGASTSRSYEMLQAHWAAPHLLLRDPPPDDKDDPWPTAPSAIESVMRYDMGHYLPDDILVKVDRAAMSASLETRAPLLDHRVVEFALGLPSSLKIRENVGKVLLRELLAQKLPRALFERPKRGFAVPLDAWLRGPLTDWVEDTLTPDTTLRQWFRPAALTNVWRQHLRGHQRSRQLWPPLMLLSWLRRHRAE